MECGDELMGLKINVLWIYGLFGLKINIICSSNVFGLKIMECGYMSYLD